MTADYIAFQASGRPDAVAVIDRGREITYAQFSRDIRAFTNAAGRFNLSRGSVVAIEWVGWHEAYSHWLLLIAFERLGVITATYLRHDQTAPLIAAPDLVLSSPRSEGEGAARHHVMSDEWLRAAFTSTDTEILAPTPKQPEDPLRILRTSGTTGNPKQVLLTRQMIEARLGRWIWSLGITRASRCLVTAPFAVTSIHNLATAVVRSGGTVVFETIHSASSMIQALTTHAISHMALNPIGLKWLLDALPDDYAKPENLTICTLGSATAASLRERALARLASEVVVYYSSNEMSFIAELRSSRSDGAYSVFPWVRAEIVDDEHRTVPPGTLGRLRLQAEAMASGYADDPQATAATFRDGWFYPGDIGILHGPHLLRIVGRNDELLNIGGQKISPSELETLVLQHARVEDVGICWVRDAEGNEEMYVAVSRPRATDLELAGQVSRAFAGLNLGSIHIVELSRIPRNANGKIERRTLRELTPCGRRTR